MGIYIVYSMFLLYFRRSLNITLFFALVNSFVCMWMERANVWMCVLYIYMCVFSFLLYIYTFFLIFDTSNGIRTVDASPLFVLIPRETYIQWIFFRFTLNLWFCLKHRFEICTWYGTELDRRSCANEQITERKQRRTKRVKEPTFIIFYLTFFLS